MAKKQKNKSGYKHHLVKTRDKVVHHSKKHLGSVRRLYKKSSVVQKIGIWLLATLIFLTSCMYGISQWYIYKHQNEPLVLGTSFIPQYARHLGLNPEEVLQAAINDLGLRRFRLVSYWNLGEPEKNQYDFSELDWQFDMIEKAGGQVTLAIGARQPRWPECHIPTWVHQEEGNAWKDELKEYMGEIIKRYKDRPSLVSYQLENEYFLEVFGECEDHTRERLVDEFNFVKALDPDTPIVVSRSNNAVPSWPIGEPRADIVGASIYKRVWDRTVTKRYFEYPFPAWFYGFLAGATEITTGKNTIIHEMQTEPWPPKDITEVSLDEQDKSFNGTIFRERVNYGVATGMKAIDLWGMEWWYYRKVKFNDFSVWEAAQETIHELQADNCRIQNIKDPNNLSC
ncbi:beta-galactosidase [Candidatus Saccharibacteria bacterium]|nr:beta-galactosidase [Candidatus Saccharibacteria bacterium]